MVPPLKAKLGQIHTAHFPADQLGLLAKVCRRGKHEHGFYIRGSCWDKGNLVRGLPEVPNVHLLCRVYANVEE